MLSLPESALFLKKFVFLEIACQLVHLLAQSDLLRVALVHQRLLLVQQFLLEFLLTDVFEFDFSLQLLFDATRFGFFGLIAVLLLVVVSFQKSFVLELLLQNALHGLAIIFTIIAGGLTLWGVSEVRKPDLGLGDVLRQDVVDIVILKLLLIFNFLLPAVFQNKLQLRLLLWR